MKCSYCLREISSTTIYCNSCGSVQLDNFDEFTDRNTLIIPSFSGDLSIGSPVQETSERARIKGDIKVDKSLSDKIYGGPGEITLYEKGLKIRDSYYEKEMEINFSQLINLVRLQWGETYQEKESPVLGVLLMILTVFTLGIILAFGVKDSFGNKRRDTLSYVNGLGVQFWDPDTKSAKRILITGSDRRIDKFIRRCNQLRAL